MVLCIRIVFIRLYINVLVKFFFMFYLYPYRYPREECYDKDVNTSLTGCAVTNYNWKRAFFLALIGKVEIFSKTVLNTHSQ